MPAHFNFRSFCVIVSPVIRLFGVFINKMGSIMNLSQRMAKMLKDSETFDVQFNFTDECGKFESLNAHKVILSNASPVFKAMFYGPLRETKDVDIVDVSKGAFQCMLKFIYTDKSDMTVEHVGEVMYLGKKYDIPGLDDECRKCIDRNMDRANVVSLYQGIRFADDQELNEKCLKLMDSNGHYVINSNHVVEIMQRETLKTIVTRGTFCAREIDIMDAIIWWHKQQPGNQNLDSTQMRELIDDLVPYIRFPTMTLKEFVQLAIPAKILSNEEVVEILATYGRQSKKKPVEPVHCRFTKEARMLGEKVVIKVDDIPKPVGIPPEFNVMKFERVSKHGLRIVRMKLSRRLFLTKIVVNNVPHRVCTDGYTTGLIVQDMELNEVVSRCDYGLKKGEGDPPVPGKYELVLKTPAELCPKVSYEIRVSIDGPKNPTIDTVKKQGATQEFTFFLERYGRIWDEDVRVEELHFLF